MKLSEENLNGKIFNRWKIIGFHEYRKRIKYFWCECLDCHNVKSVCISTVINGKSKSCGCKSHKESAYNINKKYNKYEIIDGVAHIYIESPIKCEMLCDEEDWEKLKELYIRAEVINDNMIYGITIKNYKTYKIHRLIMNIYDPKIEIDHINGNGLDNRKKNLRSCNNQQNSFNKIKPNKNNTSGYRGVYFDKDRQKWRGCIQYNGKHIKSPKRYNNPEDAFNWYKNKNIELFGEFSGFNRDD